MARCIDTTQRRDEWREERGEEERRREGWRRLESRDRPVLDELRQVQLRVALDLTGRQPSQLRLRRLARVQRLEHAAAAQPRRALRAVVRDDNVGVRDRRGRVHRVQAPQHVVELVARDAVAAAAEARRPRLPRAAAGDAELAVAAAAPTAVALPAAAGDVGV